jgi:hypothetical protein
MSDPKSVSIVSITPITSAIRRDLLLTNFIALRFRKNQWEIETVACCSSKKESVIEIDLSQRGKYLLDNIFFGY